MSLISGFAGVLAVTDGTELRAPYRWGVAVSASGPHALHQGWPLLGRSGDLEFIRSFFVDSALQGGALLLSGDAGIGKTALLDAAANAAERNGRFVLRAA